ncbi:MAG: sensor domain-containing diguanylate cyclase [bacterium]|nr:sensor domain-containing diguanylate cyclase [bacterium]
MTRLLAIILLCLWSGAGMAAAELSHDRLSLAVTDELSYLRDDGGQLQRADVLARPPGAWQANGAEPFSKGYNSATWWLRFNVRNTDSPLPRKLLEIAYPVLDVVEVWVMAGTEVKSHYLLGDKRPFNDRPIRHRQFLVPLELPAGTADTVLLRVKSTSSVQVPLVLWDEHAFFDHDQGLLLGQGIYFGTMLVMALYSLIVFLALRDRTYLYYLLYVLSLPLFVASLNGLSFQFLWPTATRWNDQALIVTLASTTAFAALFTWRFLLFSRHLPLLAKGAVGFVVCSLLIAIASFFLPYALLIRLQIVISAAGCLSILLGGAVRWYRGDVSARLYTIAWATMLLGGMVLALSKFRLLPQSVFTEYATQTGSAVGVILLSFALVSRINEERRRRHEAQQEVFEGARLLQQVQVEALAAQRKANELLEQRVHERTEALEAANLKLEALSATDQLTGMKNRRHLDRMLQDEYARCFRYQRSIAVLLLDIDHFKRFNDVWGHLVGDDCLRSVARTMMEAVRIHTDRIARYGGEEFCVVLPETGAEGAAVVAERIRVAVESMSFEVNGQRIPVTVSVGVAAVVPDAAEGSRELVKRADAALYQAKGDGRNGVVIAL